MRAVPEVQVCSLTKYVGECDYKHIQSTRKTADQAASE